MFTIVLVQPQIPPNTGNIGRLSAATDSHLHIVGNIGFDMSASSLKRAGLDYWPYANVSRFEDEEGYMNQLDPKKCHLLTKKASNLYTDVTFNDGDFLIFGSETKGLSDIWQEKFSDRLLKIPMNNSHNKVRSLNLSNAVAVVLYEGIRQLSIK